MSTSPAPTPTPYGAHIPFNVGWDAQSRKKARRATSQDASGYLQDPDGHILDLWITEVAADFSVSGQVGQSRMLREWFPRSFNDPVLKITGNVPNTQEYNRLATFIRVAQWNALQAINAGSSAKQTITFGLHNRTSPVWDRNRTRLLIENVNEVAVGSGVKGPHRPWTIDGYVKRIAAGAVRHEVAPAFSIEFVVTDSLLSANTGIWSDTVATVSPLLNVLAILGMNTKAAHVKRFVTDPVSAPGGKLAKQDVGSAIWSVTGATETLNADLFSF